MRFDAALKVIRFLREHWGMCVPLSGQTPPPGPLPEPERGETAAPRSRDSLPPLRGKGWGGGLPSAFPARQPSGGLKVTPMEHWGERVTIREVCEGIDLSYQPTASTPAWKRKPRVSPEEPAPPSPPVPPPPLEPMRDFID